MKYPMSLEEHDIKEFKESVVLNLSDGQTLKAYTHHLHNHFKILPMHSHNYYELNIITKGHGMHYIGENICSANEGNAFVIPPNMKYGYYSDEDYEIFHLIISNLFSHKYADELCALNGYSYLFEIEPILRFDANIHILPMLKSSTYEYIKAISERLIFYDEPDKAELPNRSFLKDALTLNIIAELCTVAADINSAYSKDNDETIQAYIYSIAKAMMYISEHFAEKISFHELAAQLGMSYTTFYRSFVDINKMPPAQFLKQYRIKNAIKLLNYTELSVAQIAQECGFYDSAHFIKTFTAIKHISPNDYRAIIRESM